MTMTAPKKAGRPRVRNGLEPIHLGPPSAGWYKRGCKCDPCLDFHADSVRAGYHKKKAANEEIREYVKQIRERMGV